MMPSEYRKGLIGLLLFAALVAVVLAYSKSRDPGPATGELRMNQLQHFERLAVPKCDALAADKLMLFIEGMDTGLRGAGCQDGKNRLATVSFEFIHRRPNGLTDAADQAVWSVILGRPLDTLERPRVLRYEIRSPDDQGGTQNIAPADASLAIRIFEWWAPGAVALVLLVWGALIYLAACSALVRDAAPPDTPLARRTFSLAKTQMAWWFAIVFACFVFLWLVTGETPSISGQALSLIGISSVTAVASLGLSTQRNGDGGRGGVFFRDLLSDRDGIAINRFQMVAMTITLGVVFLIHVGRHLTMPEFDGSLLTLMGISAATYVGLKIPEGGSDAKAAADAVPAPIAKAAADAEQEGKAGYTPVP